MSDPILHGYFRSSASYRVRIALNLKNIIYDSKIHHLRRGEQSAPAYLALNPQGLLPTLEMDRGILTQSLAICEYLDETHPEPRLLPEHPMRRAKIRAFAQVISCDTHPVQNLKILARLQALGLTEEQRTAWAVQVIEEGLGACDALIAEEAGPYCFGANITLGDIFLIPQLANARRFGCQLRWPRLLEIERACLSLEPFARAAPESQMDAK